MAAVSHPRLLLNGLYRRAVQGRNVGHKIDRLVVDCLVEQVPDPDSRITLSDRLDEHGLPLPRVDWKISELERRTVAELARTFSGEMKRIGLPEPDKPEWLRDHSLDAIPFTDVAHPTGTTRMADDPKKGVVDPDCGVHGVEGLFIAGSSVFPTGSHANPTLMVVALSIRLADTLKKWHLRPGRMPVSRMVP
jgi:choline dehydrogenase-like flavoprotein